MYLARSDEQGVRTTEACVCAESIWVADLARPDDRSVYIRKAIWGAHLARQDAEDVRTPAACICERSIRAVY